MWNNEEHANPNFFLIHFSTSPLFSPHLPSYPPILPNYHTLDFPVILLPQNPFLLLTFPFFPKQFSFIFLHDIQRLIQTPHIFKYNLMHQSQSIKLVIIYFRLLHNIFLIYIFHLPPCFQF